MKGVKAPDYVRKFVVREIKDGYEIKFYSEIMGETPIGERLSRAGGLPSISKTAEDRAEAMRLCEEWNTWYKSTRISSKRKKR